MPCSACKDPSRCDRAGVCQDFGFVPFPRTVRAVPLPVVSPMEPPAADRECDTPSACRWPRCTCEMQPMGSAP